MASSGTNFTEKAPACAPLTFHFLLPTLDFCGQNQLSYPLLTDLVGFSLLTPPVRKVLKRYFQKHWKSRFHIVDAPGGFPSGEERPPQDHIIDVQVRSDE